MFGLVEEAERLVEKYRGDFDKLRRKYGLPDKEIKAAGYQLVANAPNELCILMLALKKERNDAIGAYKLVLDETLNVKSADKIAENSALDAANKAMQNYVDGAEVRIALVSVMNYELHVLTGGEFGEYESSRSGKIYLMKPGKSTVELNMRAHLYLSSRI